MLERHRPSYDAMPPEAAAYLWSKAHDKWPARIPAMNGHTPSGSELFDAAIGAKLFGAELAIILAGDPAPLATQALEAIVGHPLTRSPSAPPRPETDEALRARLLSLDTSDARTVLTMTGDALDAMAAGYGLTRLNASAVRAPRVKAERVRRVRDPRLVEAVAPNPRRPGTAAHLHYNCWRVGSTVEECISAGLPPRYVGKSVKKGWVRLGKARKK